MTFDADSVKVTPGHKALAAYIKRETGKGVKPEAIALIDALRVQYRKDPSRVADREARAAAARAKKEEAYNKALAKAQALAAKLGISQGDFTLSAAPAEPEDEHEPEDEPEPEDEGLLDESEPEDEPEPPKKGRKLQAVPKVKSPEAKTPADEETLVPEIDVMEDYEGWETSPESADAEGDDFFEDEPEGEDY